MADIVGISKAFNAQLVQTVKAVRAMRGREITRPNTQKTTKFRIYAVILDEALTGGTFLAPSSGLATTCRWSVEDGEYTQTELQITVYNHSSEDHAVDTPGAAILIDGHYWFFADCEPIASRPTPPWDV